MEQVGTIVVEFDIFSTRPTNLVVADSSEWFYAENLPSFLLVKMPGSKKFKTFPFKKQALNSAFTTNTAQQIIIEDLEQRVYNLENP